MEALHERRQGLVHRIDAALHHRPDIRHFLLEMAIEVGIVATGDIADGEVPLLRCRGPALNGGLDLADSHVEQGIGKRLHRSRQPLDGGWIGELPRKLGRVLRESRARGQQQR